MGNAIGVWVLGICVLWKGISTLRRALRNRPTSRDAQDERLEQIGRGISLLFLSLLLILFGAFTAAWWWTMKNWP